MRATIAAEPKAESMPISTPLPVELCAIRTSADESISDTVGIGGCERISCASCGMLEVSRDRMIDVVRVPGSACRPKRNMVSGIDRLTGGKVSFTR